MAKTKPLVAHVTEPQPGVVGMSNAGASLERLGRVRRRAVQDEWGYQHSPDIDPTAPRVREDRLLASQQRERERDEAILDHGPLAATYGDGKHIVSLKAPSARSAPLVDSTEIGIANVAPLTTMLATQTARSAPGAQVAGAPRLVVAGLARLMLRSRSGRRDAGRFHPQRPDAPEHGTRPASGGQAITGGHIDSSWAGRASPSSSGRATRLRRASRRARTGDTISSLGGGGWEANGPAGGTSTPASSGADQDQLAGSSSRSNRPQSRCLVP